MRRISLLVAMSLMLSATAVRADEEVSGGMKSPGHLLDASPQERSQELSFFVGLPYGYFGGGFALSLGARYYIPIVKNGFIPAVNDEFGIEFGADFGMHFWSTFYPSIDIPVEALWRFHFTPKFDAYAKIGIGIGFDIGGYYYYYNNTNLYIYPYITTAVGLFYKLTDSISLRAEVGYPGIKGGIAIAF